MKLSTYIDELHILLKKYGDTDILEEYHRDDDSIKYYDDDNGPYFVDYNGVSGVVVKKTFKTQNY